MRATNTFFHDRIVLFFLTVNTFLFLVYQAFIAINYDPNASYFVQYRAGASTDEYKTGDGTDILFFSVFIAIVYVMHLVLSKRIYKDQKHASWGILSATTLVFILTFLSTWSLFKLR